MINLTTQKIKLSIKDFFIKCGQICIFLRIWSHWLKKLSVENFIFCATTFLSLECDWHQKLVIIPTRKPYSKSAIETLKERRTICSKLEIKTPWKHHWGFYSCLWMGKCFLGWRVYLQCGEWKFKERKNTSKRWEFKTGHTLQKKLFYFLQWKSFKNCKTCFLFQLESYFHS